MFKKLKRKRNNHGVIFFEFYRLSFDEKPFYTHFYRKSSDPIVGEHESFEGGPNRRPHCLSEYRVCEEWTDFHLCKRWYCSEDCFSA